MNGFLLIIIAILIYWNGKLRFQRNYFKDAANHWHEQYNELNQKHRELTILQHYTERNEQYFKSKMHKWRTMYESENK